MTDAHCHVAQGESRHFLCSPRDETLPAGRDDVVFAGFHPWDFLPGGPRERGLSPADLDALRAKLESGAAFGIGEIGLDRLKSREIPSAMREGFRAQLALAARLSRPVVLHGAKCWGEVVRECRPFAGTLPPHLGTLPTQMATKMGTLPPQLGTVPNRKGTVSAFIFHGFSRSDGLLLEIFKMNGYISIGPAILNDHAVNYREMAKHIPIDRLLVESDATAAPLGTLPSETGTLPAQMGTLPLKTRTLPRVEDVLAKLAEIRGIDCRNLAIAIEENVNRFIEMGSVPIKDKGCVPVISGTVPDERECPR